MGEYQRVRVGITGLKPRFLEVGEKIDGATNKAPLRVATEIKEIKVVTRDTVVVDGTGLVIKECFGHIGVSGGSTGSRATLIAPSWAVFQGRRDGAMSVIIAVPEGLGPKQRGARHWWGRVQGILRGRRG